MYNYTGKIDSAFISEAFETYRKYKADKEPLATRVRDDERFYQRSYSQISPKLESFMTCDTPFIFSAIENVRADVIDNYPEAHVLEREPNGSNAAELLSKIIPAQLETADFRRVFKENTRSKLKYGTAVYGVFFNDETGEIEIKSVDILDIYVDMHVGDVQDSRFLFITAAVENSLLKKMYPHMSELFGGDADIESLADTYRLADRTTVTDCYYKKDGVVHMMKLCKNSVLAATEDMRGYEKGLYWHGLFPVVFDCLYPVENCPFGFGMIDIAKPLQVEINKLDSAITENIMCNAKPRYFAKHSGGIDEEEFCDLSRSIIHYEGDSDAVKPLEHSSINEYFLIHREYKKEELKEILGNRDFQQGSTTGGVTAASAIETLRQTGEKRSRSFVSDTYDSYRQVVMMILELMRQFYEEKRYFRISDEFGKRTFAQFDRSIMYSHNKRPLAFDISVVPQKESPYARESANKTIMSFWEGGMFNGENIPAAVAALKNMNFDGKEQLIADLGKLGGNYGETQGQGND